VSNACKYADDPGRGTVSATGNAGYLAFAVVNSQRRDQCSSVAEQNPFVLYFVSCFSEVIVSLVSFTLQMYALLLALNQKYSFLLRLMY